MSGPDLPLISGIMCGITQWPNGATPPSTTKESTMFFKRLAYQIRSCVANIIRKVEERFKQWTKPGTEALVEGTWADVMRSKGELIAENALLR
jgi:hypothetical protein